MKQEIEGTTKLTRVQLYEQIWTTPMLRLALSLGLSDVGLAKICKKHKIPRPSVGYWARLEHGKHPSQTRLPQLDDKSLNVIVISPRAVSISRATGPPRFQVPVPMTLSKSHALVADSMRALKDGDTDDYGRLHSRLAGVLDVRVSKEALERAMRICDGLAKALKSCGGKLRASSKPYSRETFAELDGEHIQLSIIERAIRVEEEVSAAEEQRRSRAPSIYDRVSYVYKSTGLLTLRIEEILLDGTRKNWADGKRKRLEDHLPEFLEVLHDIAAKKKADRVLAEKRAEERRELERVRQEKLRLIQDEERRLNRLLEEVESWQLSQRIRGYVQYVTERITEAHGEIEKGNDFFKWADWAKGHADHIDPLLESAPSILDERAKWEQPSRPW